MHLLLSIPSEKSTSFKLCVYFKNHCVQKCLCSFYFQDKKHWCCIPASPPIPPPQEVWCSGTNLLQYFEVNIYLLEKSEFRMEKVSEKQGSSAVDVSIAMMAAFFRHCTRAAAVAAGCTPEKHSIVAGYLICRAMIWTYIINEGLSTVSNPGASLMPTKQVTAQIEQHSTVQGKWFTRVCPVRTNPKSHCCQQSTAAGTTKPEAKCVDDSWSCESDDESADDTNTTSRKSYLHHSQIGLEQIRKLARKKWLPLCLALGESCAWKTKMVTLKTSIWSSQKRL